MSYFDRIALENLATDLGLTGRCPSNNGLGIGCTNPKGHGGRHFNQWGSTEAWDDDPERDRAYKARKIAEHLAPVVKDWKISDIEQAAGYAFVDLLNELGITKPTGDK